MQRDEPLEIVREIGAVFRLAADECVARKVMRVAQVINASDKRAEHLAVVGDAADGGAAEVDAVVAALAADEPHLRAVSFGAMVGDGHLERGLDRFRARVREEDVLEAFRSDRRSVG